MKAYVLAYTSPDGVDHLLCESDSVGPKGERMIGAFIPGKEGNYYKQVCIGFTGKGERQYTPGFEEWWEWLKQSFEDGHTLIDEEFNFDPAEVRVITFDIDTSVK